VEALGGVLDVESPEGAGTLLTATFPLSRVAAPMGA
jgi:signal transduction histidine kinase